MNTIHGTAKANKDFGDTIKEGDEGIITAYLPDRDKFAIDFGKGKWITFNLSEREFKQDFEVNLK